MKTPRNPKDLAPGQTCWLERGLFARKTKAGEIRYGISYMAPNGRRVRETVGPLKSEAKDVLALRRAEIRQGRYDFVGTKKKAPTFAEFAKTYMEKHAKQHKRSWNDDRYMLKIINRTLGTRRLDSITSWDIEQLKASRREQISPATVNRYIALLKCMFNLAIKWGKAETNPVTGVSRYKEPERLDRVLTRDEEAALLEAAPPHVKPVVTIGLNSGMRSSELLSLDWAQVDMIGGTITVKKSKSGKIRHIPINTAARRTLEELGVQQSGAVFTYQGRKIKRLARSFDTAVGDAGIARCTPHSMRHTFATRLIEAGVDLVTVKELLGHANIATTMRYAHPRPEHKRNAVESILNRENRSDARSGIRKNKLAVVNSGLSQDTGIE